MADIDTLRTLAERLDSHMGNQDVAVLLRDCRAASVGILELLDEVESLRAALTEARNYLDAMGDTYNFTVEDALARIDTALAHP